MRSQIRRAIPADAAAISQVAGLAGVAVIDAESPRVSQILDESRTLVATIDGAVVGFADGFITAGPGGVRRFELDLLAVAPAAQGRGVGGRLLQASLALAAEAGARRIRALVRSENGAMRRLCHCHGFTRSPGSFELFIIEPQAVAPKSRRHDARLIAVETLAYAGLWLEGELSQAAINEAHRLASRSDLALIGAVIPGDAAPTGNLLRANGFQRIGAYHWWTINR